ncbi:MAG: non-canonical purine NTP pyrophosphatase [Candidatus Dormibacteria bacterium]
MASRNRGKVGELRRLLRPLGWRLLALDDVPTGELASWVEDGSTYQDNALIKARAVSEATGLPALADDSGLEVLALDGWPGLNTARWLGEGATAKQLLLGLVERVSRLPPARRQARFVCCLALVRYPGPEHPEQVLAEGSLRGHLLTSPRGGGGFGYDPIFVPDGELRTMAEMSRAQKDGMSHRALAVGQLRSRLP